MRDPSYPMPKAKPLWKRSGFKQAVIYTATLLFVVAAEVWPSLPWGKITPAALGAVGAWAALFYDQSYHQSVALDEAQRIRDDAVRVGKARASGGGARVAQEPAGDT